MLRVKLRRACFIVLMLAATMSLSLVSCESVSNPFSSTEVVKTDSTVVASYVEAIVNPQFESVQEIKMFQSRLVEEYIIDETFRTMPIDVLNNVATVCLKKNVYVTKKDIVSEYRANSSVYDNLSDQSTQSTNLTEQTDPTTERPAVVAAIVSYHYDIDTIDGKPVKVLVEEKRYEAE